MKIIFFILSLFCLSLSAGKAQAQYAIDQIPAALKTRAAATIRQENLDLELLANGQVIQKVTKAITVYNKNGDYYAALPVYYSKNSSIKELKGLIFNEFGIQIAKINEKNFQDNSAVSNGTLYSDSRIKYYVPHQLDYPYTIEYQYEIRHKQNLVLPSWHPRYSNDVSVEKSSFQLSSPAAMPIRIHTVDYPYEAKKTSVDQKIIQNWAIENIPALRYEPNSPDFYASATQVQIVPEKFNYYATAGVVKDWKDFGSWMQQNLLKGKQDLSNNSKSMIVELTKNAHTPQEKAKLIYAYMQNKTRYISVQIGIGGLEPFAASEVERLGYGDCKGLVNYMQNLLSFVDIPSYYTIVEAGRSKSNLKSTFANAQDGNHVILCIPFENDTTWLECTSQTLPFGFLDDFTDDRLVLACTEDGGKILKTPQYSRADNLQIRDALLKLDANGNITGTVRTTFSGARYSDHYDVIMANTAEKEKVLSKHYNIDNINFTAINYTEHKTDTPSIAEEFQLFLKSYAVLSDKKIFIQPNIFNIQSNISPIKNRKNALLIQRGYTEIDRIIIDLPPMQELIIPIENTKYSCAMGTYEMTLEIKAGKLMCTRSLIIEAGLYPAASYNEYVAFSEKVNSADRVRFTLPMK